MGGMEYTNERWDEVLEELELEELYCGDGGVALVALPEKSQTQFNYGTFREKENLYYFFQGMLLQKHLSAILN